MMPAGMHGHKQAQRGIKDESTTNTTASDSNVSRWPYLLLFHPDYRSVDAKQTLCGQVFSQDRAAFDEEPGKFNQRPSISFIKHTSSFETIMRKSNDV
jgi:hypothetical protein